MNLTSQNRHFSAHNRYESPLETRYSSPEMSWLFSAQMKHSTWRRLWVALAEAEKELGLNITKEQIEELKKHIENIDFKLVEDYEKEFNHDVMAHIHAYSDLCPNAKPIIHLGATSCYVTDNTDTIIMREGLKLIINNLKKVIHQLSDFAKKYANQPCLSYTHFQPAQLTTVGKRACLWIQDLQIDLEEITYRMENIRFLGVKGTTGTQASFLSLFNGNHEKVKKLDILTAKKMGFSKLFPISGQTYTRKQDTLIINALSGFAESAHKMCTDIRILAGLKEIEEPFGKNQIGSSAMPYKRNPMLCERICSLSRFLTSLSANPAQTHSTQWLERSLDDSANRRLTIPEAFLTADALLLLLLKVTDKIVVNEKVIDRRIAEELPFMAAENILMASVKNGGDRQDLHERLRVHSQKAADVVKKEGKPNDLIDRILQDSAFSIKEEDLNNILNIRQFIGRAPEQVEEYLTT